MQRFCKEAITWKTLQHPNVLPLIGVTMTKNKFALISDWMTNGNLNEFVNANPTADRLRLVRLSFPHSIRFGSIDDRMIHLAGRHR